MALAPGTEVSSVRGGTDHVVSTVGHLEGAEYLFTADSDVFSRPPRSGVSHSGRRGDKPGDVYRAMVLGDTFPLSCGLLANTGTEDARMNAAEAEATCKALVTVESGFRDLRDVIEMRPHDDSRAVQDHGDGTVIRRVEVTAAADDAVKTGALFGPANKG